MRDATSSQKVVQGEAANVEPDGLDLFDVLLILAAKRRRIAFITFSTALLGALLSVILKPTFTATAMIMPPQQPQSAAAMLNQIGSLAALAGGGAPLKSAAESFIGLLDSRTIADNIIAKFRLQSVYGSKSAEGARKQLKANTRLLATTDGLIHIIVEDHSAQRASDIANAYVDQLHALNSHLAITEAAQRRLFFDEELQAERTALALAEEALKQNAEKSGIVQLPAQAESVIRNIAQLRAEIAAQEVRIQALGTFATAENPEVVQAKEEANALRDQLAKLERDPRSMQSGSPDFSAGSVPGVSLEYSRKFRDFKYHEALVDLLSKQYEAARIDEAKAAPVIQVVDSAVPPDVKSAPSRKVLTLGFAFIGFVIACVATLFMHAFHRMEQTPKYASKIDRLRRILRGPPRRLNSKHDAHHAA